MSTTQSDGWAVWQMLHLFLLQSCYKSYLQHLTILSVSCSQSMSVYCPGCIWELEDEWHWSDTGLKRLHQSISSMLKSYINNWILLYFSELKLVTRTFLTMLLLLHTFRSYSAVWRVDINSKGELMHPYVTESTDLQSTYSRTSFSFSGHMMASVRSVMQAKIPGGHN